MTTITFSGGFWPEGDKWISILEYFEVKSLHLTVDMQNQTKPNIVYFVPNSSCSLELRAVSFHLSKGTTKLYFWNSEAEVLELIKSIPSRYILKKGIWSKDGYYLIMN